MIIITSAKDRGYVFRSVRLSGLSVCLSARLHKMLLTDFEGIDPCTRCLDFDGSLEGDLDPEIFKGYVKQIVLSWFSSADGTTCLRSGLSLYM